jgi:hypothetical protein
VQSRVAVEPAGAHVVTGRMQERVVDGDQPVDRHIASELPPLDAGLEHAPGVGMPGLVRPAERLGAELGGGGFGDPGVATELDQLARMARSSASTAEEAPDVAAWNASAARATVRSMTASRIASRVAKCAYTVTRETPARAATAEMLAARPS